MYLKEQQVPNKALKYTQRFIHKVKYNFYCENIVLLNFDF